MTIADCKPASCSISLARSGTYMQLKQLNPPHIGFRPLRGILFLFPHIEIDIPFCLCIGQKGLNVIL